MCCGGVRAGRIWLCCRVNGSNTYTDPLGFDAITDRIDAGPDEGCAIRSGELIELHHADPRVENWLWTGTYHRLVLATNSGTGE